MGPKVTVYMPNYNYGRFIKKAIESVLRQTLADFELIIIDDGSSDDSHSIIEQYSDNPKIVTIFQENKGLAVTNNIALRLARGEFFIRLDPDDWLDEHALAILARQLDQDPEAGLVFPDFYRVDLGGEVIGVFRRHDFESVTILDQPAHGACTMFRTRVLANLGGYDEAFQCQDGWDIWIRLVQNHKVINVNLPLFYYREHGENLTRDETRLLNTRSRIIQKGAERLEESQESLAIIPIRGPSIDPRSLALCKLGKRYVMDWTINAALKSRNIKKVMVSSSDPSVLDHVQRSYGEDVMLHSRSPRLARLNSHVEETLRDALNELGESFLAAVEAIAVLFIESPFRTSSQIDSAIDMLSLFDADCVVGVRPEVDEFFRHGGEGLHPVRKDPMLRLEREELYRSAGNLTVVSHSYFQRSRAIVGGKIGHVVVDEAGSLTLNSPWDIAVAQFYAANPDTFNSPEL